MRKYLSLAVSKWNRFRREKSRLYALLAGSFLASVAGAGAIWGWKAAAVAGILGVVGGAIGGQRAEKA